jgi:acyl transferase domain-containing protein
VCVCACVRVCVCVCVCVCVREREREREKGPAHAHWLHRGQGHEWVGMGAGMVEALDALSKTMQRHSLQILHQSRNFV